MAKITTHFNEGLAQATTNERNSFVFIDNPVIIDVEDFNTLFDERAIFPQFVIEVTSVLSSGESKVHKYTISLGSISDKVSLDISSAIRGAMDRYEYTSESVQDGGLVAYPYVTFHICAYEKYIDESGITNLGNKVEIKNLVGYHGGLSSYERWLSGDSNQAYPDGNLVRFSTKPDGEIVFNGQLRSESYFSPPKSDYVRATVCTRFFTSNQKTINLSDRMSRDNCGVYHASGDLSPQNVRFTHSGFVDVSGICSFKFKNPLSTTFPTLGMAFYDKDKEYISGIPVINELSEADMWRYETVDVPDGARYARFTWYIYTDSYGEMEMEVLAWKEIIDHRPRTTMLFVNSRGVLETISLFAKESKEYEISSEVMAVGRTPSYSPQPGMTTHKTLGNATWQMSSGFVNRDWAEWFVVEFLTSKKYWMLIDGRWLPVVVSSKESITVYDRNDTSLRDVQFTVVSAIGGRVG